MKVGRILELGIDQGNHTPEDAIGLGKNVLKITVKNQSNSSANLWLGLNAQASDINLLEPGESVSYHDDRVCLDGTELYLQFDPANTGGRALVSIIYDTEKDNC